MAKKRKKDKAKKEEEYEFRPPEFDEKEFIKKELRDTKTVLITVGYAAFFGVLATALAHISNNLIGLSFLLVFVGLYSLKYFYPFLKIKTEDFQKKNWAGNVAWFFLTFLAVWILTFNFPISDHADPKVEDIVVWVTNEDTGNITAIDYVYIPSQGSYGWDPRDDGEFDGIIAANGNFTVNITARVTDNGNLRITEISVGDVQGIYSDMEDDADVLNRFDHEIGGEDLEGLSRLFFFIHAVDDHDNDITFVPVTGIPFAS
ncbi:MAG: hypothetical protein WBC49_07185 [Thermoplasmata archaeon]